MQQNRQGPTAMRPERAMPFVIVLLGASATVLQVTALRELITVFAGSELDLGITLACWLAAVGAGSAAGGRLRSAHAFGAAVLAAGILAQPLLELASEVRTLLDLSPGEALSPAGTVASTAAVLTPFCLLLGAQFPLAVRALGGRAGQAYLLEAAGACAGGVIFTLLLAGRVGAPEVLAAVALLHVLLGAVLLKRAAVLMLLVLPLAVHAGLAGGRAAPVPGDRELVERRESRYGVIEVFRDRGQLNFFAAGRFQFAYPDRETEELRTHIPLALHRRPERVLLVGGSPAVLREVMKHGVVGADLVELDPALLDASRGLLSPEDRSLLDDGRVRTVADDARRFIRSHEPGRYDLIVLNLPEPTTANLNRCYTAEFFSEARRALRPGGIITVTLPASFAYVGKRMQTANGAVFQALAAAFPATACSSEEYGLLAGSDAPLTVAPSVLRQRLAGRDVRTAFLPFSLLDDVFAPDRVQAHRTRLEAVREVNRDGRPVAYLAHVQVWIEQQRGSVLLMLADHGRLVLLLALAALVGSAAALRKQRGAVAFSVFLAGYGSLSVSLVILLAYQSAYGSVYERLGLLTAVFMAGTAAGARYGRDAVRPLALLTGLEASAVVLFACAPFFFRHEALFLLINGLTGALGGALFSAAIAFRGGGDAADHAGRLYGVDLAGSFLGALFSAMITVPLIGLYPAVLLVVLLKLVSLALIVSLRHA
jgi:spermidine synthase